MSATQNERVLRALRNHPAGLCQGDFIQTPAIDGGHRLTRLAARIQDLKDAGHRIEVVGKRDRYAVYALTADATVTNVRRPASFWRGSCAECRAVADLAYRPGTTLKVCSRCMWPEDYTADERRAA